MAVRETLVGWEYAVSDDSIGWGSVRCGKTRGGCVGHLRRRCAVRCIAASMGSITTAMNSPGAWVLGCVMPRIIQFKIMAPPVCH